MSAGGTDKVKKHPTASFAVAFLYTNGRLPTGVTIASGVATARNQGTLDDTSFGEPGAVLDASAAVVDTGSLRVSIGILDGTDGEEHLVTIASTLSTGEVIVDQFLLAIDDGPDS